MAAASRGLMSNPSSASLTAGANRSRQACLAVLGVDVVEHPHDAGHSDGAARGAGVGLRLGPVGVGDPAQVVLGRRGGRDLTAVVGLYRTGGGVVVEQEAAAAESRGLRLDQPEHRLRGDERIRGGATVTQHVAGGPRRERVRGGHGEPVGAHGGHVLAVAGCGLGGRRGLPVGRRRSRGLRRRGAVGDDLARTCRSRSSALLAGAPSEHQRHREERRRHLAGGQEPHRCHGSRVYPVGTPQ